MLNNQRAKSGMKCLLRSLACTLISTAMLCPADGQVVLVSSKLRASRPVSKVKSKSRNKPQASTTPLIESFVLPEMASSKVTPQELSFAVIPPVLSKEVKEPEAVAKSAAWPELMGYEFEVIKSDDRGHERERRKERARFYLEALSGGVNLEMVEIPAGTFLMGNNSAEIEQLEASYSRNLAKEDKQELQKRLQAETPQRMVKVSVFYASKYEVTQAQWRAVASLPKVNRELMSDPSQFKGGNRPVEQVSWEDAVEFCERLSRATGRHYRLPTEAEWEYSCRAGTNWQFSLGETVSPDWVNYNGKLPYGLAPKDSYRQQTVPVGSLGLANAFGLYDTHGNVWEWCLDSWHENYSEAPTDNSVWDKNGVKDLRVLRGGAWDSSAGECRSSERRQASPISASSGIGFRVVAEASVVAVNK